MGAPALALSVALLSAAQGDEPQLVVLPLEAEGVKPQLGLDAWKTVVAEVAKAKGKLHVGVTFQKELHDMLLGPAREQARDCGSNVDCLREIGRALDVAQLIAGKVTKDDVSLVAFDVATGAKLGAAKSPPTVSKAKVESKAKAAAQSLIAVMAAKKAGKQAPVASVQTSKEPAQTTTTQEQHSGGGEDLKEDKVASNPTPPVTATSSVSQGKIHIGKDQLLAVKEISIDGTTVLAQADGSILWSGAAGSHALVFLRNDGSKEMRNLLVESGKTAEAVLGPPTLAQNNSSTSNATRVDNSAQSGSDDVTSTWWFWTALATAVLAGSATTVVLAGGLKGGPSVPNDSGTVSGTY